VAVLVPIEDLSRLERLEDLADVRAAEAAEAEAAIALKMTVCSFWSWQLATGEKFIGKSLNLSPATRGFYLGVETCQKSKHRRSGISEDAQRQARFNVSRMILLSIGQSRSQIGTASCCRNCQGAIDSPLSCCLAIVCRHGSQKNA
jgi:hypothetical protein